MTQQLIEGSKSPECHRAGEDRRTWWLRPVCACSTLSQGGLVCGQRRRCPLATLGAGSRIHLTLLAPWSHHPDAGTTLCTGRGCVWASWLCQAVGQRGETILKTVMSLTLEDEFLLQPGPMWQVHSFLLLQRPLSRDRKGEA